MSSPRVIKKYPNRRLYDTEESRYITLADIRKLVIKDVDFVVTDKKTGDDITRTILLQVISDQEQQGEAVMSEDFLAQVIRAYGTVVPDFMTRYLEQSIKLFMSQQQYLHGRVQRVVGTDPLSVIADLTQKNLRHFQSLQEEAFSRFAGSGKDTDDDEPTAPENRQKAG